MRHALVFVVLVIFFIFGCSENSSLVNPVSESNDLEWISFTSNTLAKKGKTGDLIFKSVVTNKKGGKVTIKVKDDISIKGQLKVPKKAINEKKKEITVDLSGEFATVDFRPSGEIFNKDLKFTMTYQGINPDDFEGAKFAYFNESSGEIEIIDNAVISIKGDKVTVVVYIDHFSRFGFIR